MTTTASDAIAIDVLLQPDETLSARMRALNAWLRESHPGGFALDGGHVPHVTLVQRYIVRDRLDEALAATVRTLGEIVVPDKLLATGLDIAPRTGIATVSVNVERTTSLVELQARLADALAPFAALDGDDSAFFRDEEEPLIEPSMVEYVRSFVPSRMGDRYEPHITVGRASPEAARRLEVEGFPRLQFGVERAAVFQLGHAGTARRRLWP